MSLLILQSNSFEWGSFQAPTRKGPSLLLYVLVVFSCLAWGSVPAALAETTQYVQVRTAQIRVEPKSFSKVVKSLRYRDEVTELEEKDGWLKVRASGGATGYLHESALTTTRIVSSTEKLSPYASESDVVLAGKGFSEEVEDEYRRQNPGTRSAFSSINQIEQAYRGWNPSIENFRRSGKIQEGKG